MKPIIEIENISKKYKITGTEQPYYTLRDKITSWVKPKNQERNEIWALKDISFNVNISGADYKLNELWGKKEELIPKLHS